MHYYNSTKDTMNFWKQTYDFTVRYPGHASRGQTFFQNPKITLFHSLYYIMQGWKNMFEVFENMFAMFKILESGTEEAHKLITRILKNSHGTNHNYDACLMPIIRIFGRGFRNRGFNLEINQWLFLTSCYFFKYKYLMKHHF